LHSATRPAQPLTATRPARTANAKVERPRSSGGRLGGEPLSAASHGGCCIKPSRQSCCVIAEMSARAAGCDDLGADAPRVTNAWPISEPTLRNDPAASPGVCATASMQSNSPTRGSTSPPGIRFDLGSTNGKRGAQPPRREGRRRAGCRGVSSARRSAGCDEGGSSSSCSSISASRRRVRSSSWSRSGDGGLASSRRASLRTCIARFSAGSIVFSKGRG
jgi:hypothetical protein